MEQHTVTMHAFAGYEIFPCTRTQSDRDIKRKMSHTRSFEPWLIPTPTFKFIEREGETYCHDARARGPWSTPGRSSPGAPAPPARSPTAPAASGSLHRKKKEKKRPRLLARVHEFRILDSNNYRLPTINYSAYTDVVCIVWMLLVFSIRINKMPCE